VLRAARETESTQENIQDWLELNVGDPELQLMTARNYCSNFFYLLSTAPPIFSKFLYCLLGLYIASLNRIID
jgi:hypothetical protein